MLKTQLRYLVTRQKIYQKSKMAGKKMIQIFSDFTRRGMNFLKPNNIQGARKIPFKTETQFDALNDFPYTHREWRQIKLTHPKEQSLNQSPEPTLDIQDLKSFSEYGVRKNREPELLRELSIALQNEKRANRGDQKTVSLEIEMPNAAHLESRRDRRAGN